MTATKRQVNATINVAEIHDLKHRHVGLIVVRVTWMMIHQPRIAQVHRSKGGESEDEH